MRKSILLFSALWVTLLLCCSSLLAQERTISGTILSEDNKTPLQGVTVRVKGTKRVTQTDAKGTYSIKASPGETIQFTHVGYQIVDIKVGTGNNVSVSMKISDVTMGEVVVTAMDIKRTPRELGYSVQTVKGSDIQQTQRENFVNALQGRVAGLTVTPTTGTAGASSGIILRGFNSLSGTNQPLFVVDGIILDNQTLNTNSQGGAGIGLASDGNNRNFDATNRIADLNPNDIETVTVLKGPEATALYGSQASNGAIVITTKKAQSTAGKVNVTYDNNFRFQKIIRFAEVNNAYGPGGSNGIPTAPPLTGQFTSFGPPWSPGTTLYDNIHHFFKTGFTQTHNLGLEFGTKNVGFRVTGQYLNDKGTVPFNTYTKYSFKVSNTTKIGKWLNITPTIAYTDADNLQPLKSSSGSSGIGAFMVELYEWPANNDIRNYQNTSGAKLPLFQSNVNADFDNPFWSAKNVTSGSKTKRWIATLGIDINPFKWLALAGRFGYDTYKSNGYVFIHPQSYQLTSATNGTLDSYFRTYIGYNHTITATAKKTIKDISGRIMVGTMWQDLETKAFGVYGNHVTDSVVNGVLYKNGSVITGFNPWDTSSTVVSSRQRLLRNVYGLPNLNIFREIAYFGEVSISYKNVAFLSYTQRFESASPLPAQNRNYHYPGASASIILSDLIPAIKKGNIINFAKLRASLANTARINDPYSNQSNFVNNQNSSMIQGFTYGFTNGNPFLRPEKQKTYEIGTELRLFNNIISLEAAYYNTLCTDQIAQGYRASYATGFILNTTNAAALRNEGVELTVNLLPIRGKDFSWMINFNFNHMWSNVLQLPESIGPLNDFYNSDTYISNVRGGLIRGHSTGTITGSTYTRNNKGDILITPTTGLPVITTGNSLIGDRTPAFTLGTLNSFRYRNWSLSFLWDIKMGGDVYNGTDQILTGLGKSARTANRTTPVVIKGVLNDGLQNTANPTVNTIVVIPYYQSTYYTSLPDEEFIQKNVNWLRLRDITLSYSAPQKIIRNIKALKGAGFFITGNDLVLITNYKGADPAINSNNPGTRGVGGYGFDLGSTAAPMSLSFGIRANF